MEYPNSIKSRYKATGGAVQFCKQLNRDIPEGWSVKSVKDVICHINTGLNPRDNFILNDCSDVKYITVKNLTTYGSLDFNGCDYISFETKNLINRRSKISKGDILFASIAPLGRCYLIQETPKDWEINESVFTIRPNTNLVTSEYLYLFFMSDEFIHKAEHSSTGSVFSGIRISVLEDISILIPPQSVLQSFSNATAASFRKIYKNQTENAQLIQIRKWLLPMLMNGQATISD